MMVVPNLDDNALTKLLTVLNAEFDVEQVPLQIESYSKIQNCYMNVGEKVRRDGGRIVYGWAIWKGSLICEAEHHAVWENEDEALIDITPQNIDTDRILFLPDDRIEYVGRPIPNVRISISPNPLVDHYLRLAQMCDFLERYGERIDDEKVWFTEDIKRSLDKFRALRENVRHFIYEGGKLGSLCYCGSAKKYLKCHGESIQKIIELEQLAFRKKYGE